jgi:voltage-gated potassium channel
MAQLMIKPQVSSFVNAMTSSEAPDLSFEEIEVTSSSGAAGRTIGSLNILSETGANIVAVRKLGGALDLRPTRDTLLEEFDVIVGLGSPAEIKKLEEMFEHRDVAR